MRKNTDPESRILLLVPTLKDADATSHLMNKYAIPSFICRNLNEICDEFKKGAAAIIITQEAVLLDKENCLRDALYVQEPWSDIPVIVLTAPGPDSARTFEQLETVGHMTLIKRPVQLQNLISTVRSALRDRKRQYGIRDYLNERRIQNLKLEAAAAKANAANIAKSEFLANMSHEIRTPMNAIIGLSNILSRSAPLTDNQKKYVETLRQSGESLLMLINDLLDITKIESSGIEIESIRFDINQILSEIVGMISVRAMEKGLELTADATTIKDTVFIGDPTRLRQIITNLCSNAVKFTNSGKISIKASMRDIKAGHCNLIIGISDTGVGIAPDKLDTIFEKFTQADNTITRKFGGTGLGLTISKTLAELMGGKIEVRSTVGVGSEFTVTIPLKIDTGSIIQAPRGDPEPKNDNEPKKGRVLLVEDNEPNVLVASTYLDTFGYAYDVARSGADAVEKALSNRYMAILMDIQMPELNGFDASAVIRNHERETGTPPALIIGMTAHALDGDKARCLEAGMDDYISKPFLPTELQKKLSMTARQK